MMRAGDAMMRRVRTTVDIDDELLRRARELALRDRRSLGDVVSEALRVLLAEPTREQGPVRLPTYGGSGLRAGVDLEDKDALADLLDDVVPDVAG